MSPPPSQQQEQHPEQHGQQHGQLQSIYARLLSSEKPKLALVLTSVDETSSSPYSFHPQGVGVVWFEDDTTTCDVLFQDGTVLEEVPSWRMSHVTSSTDMLTSMSYDAHLALASSHHTQGRYALAAAEFLAASEHVEPETSTDAKLLFRAGDAVDVKLQSGRWRRRGVVTYTDEDDETADVMFNDDDDEYDTADDTSQDEGGGGGSSSSDASEMDGVSFANLRHAQATASATSSSTTAPLYAKALLNAALCHMHASRPLPALRQASQASHALARLGQSRLLAKSHFVRALAHARMGDFAEARLAADMCEDGASTARLRHQIASLQRERRASDARIAKAVRELLEGVNKL